MKVDAVDGFRRGEHAAEIVERAILARGLDAGLREYAELRGAGRADLFFSEAAFNDLGYRFLQDGKLSEAIAVFKLNVASFPESANAHDSLGEAYMKNGQNGLAADSYRKSLELNPANENAARMLEKLGGR
jgi:tetratricopeptide (TPR) repeat protein